MTLELHRRNICVNSVPFPPSPTAANGCDGLTANHTREQLGEAVRCMEQAARSAGLFGENGR